MSSLDWDLGDSSESDGAIEPSWRADSQPSATMTSRAYSPSLPPFEPSLPRAYSPSSPPFEPSSPPFEPSSPQFAPSSPPFEPSSPPFAPSSPQFAPSLPKFAPGENPFTCPTYDKYTTTKSTTNQTLPAFLQVWTSRQTKANRPDINKLDGRGRLTRFERAKLLGFRATRLEQGDAPRVPTSIQDTVFTVAEREFDLGLLGDYLVDRVHPDGRIETIPVGRLAWIE